MSKLDDILSHTANLITRGIVTDHWEVANTKNELKAMILNLIQTSKNKADLIKKVKEL